MMKTTNEMNVKIEKLVKYINDNFPDGCGHTGPCPVGCPLRRSERSSIDSDVCDMLANQEYRTND